jgi:Spy/CpxP family protein refolding chaperone
MKKILFILFALLTGFAQAQDPFKGKLYTTAHLMDVREEINLSDAQVAKIKKLHAENSGSFSSMKWDLDEANSNLRKMLDQPKIDQVAVSKQLDEVLRLENQLKKIQLNTMVAIKNELSAEQVSKLEQSRIHMVGKTAPSSGNQVHVISGSPYVSSYNGTLVSTSPKLSVSVAGTAPDEQPIYFLETKSGMKRVNGYSDIDNSQIESVSVFKGDQAIEKYGKEAKNGVVVIRLKNMPE